MSISHSNQKIESKILINNNLKSNNNCKNSHYSHSYAVTNIPHNQLTRKKIAQNDRNLPVHVLTIAGVVDTTCGRKKYKNTS